MVPPLSCWLIQGQAGQGVEAVAVTQDSPTGRAGPPVWAEVGIAARAGRGHSRWRQNPCP